MSETVISVKNISKSYRVYKNNQQRLNNMLFGMDTGEKKELLKDISFDIYKGEKVGLIGTHAAGKTTLMQILAGIILPDSGSFSINGTPGFVFDLRFCLDLSVDLSTNIQMRGAALGWTKEETKRKEEEILSFLELSDVRDKALRVFPRGTATRIGFVIATMERPEILLYDESFGVGGNTKDAEKFQDRMKEFILRDEATVLMTFLNPNVGKQYCDRGIVIMDGEVAFDGPYPEASKFYKAHTRGKDLRINEVLDDSAADDMSDDVGDSGDFGF